MSDSLENRYKLSMLCKAILILLNPFESYALNDASLQSLRRNLVCKQIWQRLDDNLCIKSLQSMMDTMWLSVWKKSLSNEGLTAFFDHIDSFPVSTNNMSDEVLDKNIEIFSELIHSLDVLTKIKKSEKLK